MVETEHEIAHEKHWNIEILAFFKKGRNKKNSRTI